MDGFYSDPWGPSDGGSLGLGDGLTVADIGPQSDGTYYIPAAAQQYNNPANTAGYDSPMSQQTYRLLSQGLGVLGQSFNLSQMLDYRKFEATNGGLFMQGQGAYGRTGTVLRPNYTLLLLLAGGLFVMLKD